MLHVLIRAVFCLVLASQAFAADRYEIEAAGNDEVFVIDGNVFKAKVYCMGWDVGDKVVFLEGSSSGLCVSAKLYNTSRRQTCEVWCE
jgi:hypothetical protein